MKDVKQVTKPVGFRIVSPKMFVKHLPFEDGKNHQRGRKVQFPVFFGSWKIQKVKDLVTRKGNPPITWFSTCLGSGCFSILNPAFLGPFFFRILDLVVLT